jgi:protein-S-isoprenylcysteine O-methyltransferase Ste14
MNPRETALIGFGAAVFSIVCCQWLGRAAWHHAQLSGAQARAGLAICLAGVVVGVLLASSASALREAASVWDRSVGALGLALGCVLLLALMVGTRRARGNPAPQAAPESASAQSAAPGRGRAQFARGTSR